MTINILTFNCSDKCCVDIWKKFIWIDMYQCLFLLWCCIFVTSGWSIWFFGALFTIMFLLVCIEADKISFG